MSYGLPEQPRRRGGLGRLILPAIIVFGALMIFQSMSAQREEPNAPQDRGGQGGLVAPDHSSANDEYKIKEGLFESDQRADSSVKPMPSKQSGQWSMEEVDVDGGTKSFSSTPQSKTTTNGEWSMEEVDGETTKAKPQFKFSEQ